MSQSYCRCVVVYHVTMSGKWRSVLYTLSSNVVWKSTVSSCRVGVVSSVSRSSDECPGTVKTSINTVNSG